MKREIVLTLKLTRDEYSWKKALFEATGGATAAAALTWVATAWNLRFIAKKAGPRSAPTKKGPAGCPAGPSCDAFSQTRNTSQFSSRDGVVMPSKVAMTCC